MNDAEPLPVRSWVWPVEFTRRLAVVPALALSDGSELSAIRGASVFLTPIAVIIGFVVATGQLGYEVAYTSSLPAVGLALASGALGARVGLLFLLGFILGDLAFVAHPDPATTEVWWSQQPLVNYTARVLAPRAPSYLGLWLIAVQLPLFLSQLSRLVPLRRFTTDAALILLNIVRAILAYGAVLVWTQITPLLMRPMFTWNQDRVPVEAIANVQTRGHLLAAIFVTLFLLRALWQVIYPRVSRHSHITRRIWVALAELPPAVPRTQRVSQWWRSAGRIGLLMMFIAGMLSHWLEAAIVAVILFVVEAARRGLVFDIAGWARIVHRVPYLARVGAIVGFAFLAGQMLITADSITSDPDSFRPLVSVVALTFVVGGILTPELPETMEEEAGPVEGQGEKTRRVRWEDGTGDVR